MFNEAFKVITFLIKQIAVNIVDFYIKYDRRVLGFILCEEYFGAKKNNNNFLNGLS